MKGSYLDETLENQRSLLLRNYGATGFSLLELLLVMAIAGILAAIAAPQFTFPPPSRKAAAYELVRVLELARSTAEAEEREIMVAFANGRPKKERFQFRAYSIFAYAEDGDIVQVSNWSFLPEGIVFGNSSHFESPADRPLATVFDIAGRRAFPVKQGVATAQQIELPYLAFHPDGGVSHPPIWEAFAANVAIVEGFTDPSSNSIALIGESGNGRAKGELVSIAYRTGGVRLLTD